MKAKTRSSRSGKSSQAGASPVHSSKPMPVINPHAAGIDIGATSHWVCLPEDAVAAGESPVREFGALTKDLDSIVSKTGNGGAGSVVGQCD